MAFLYCRLCGWSQDDFYSVNGYNPAYYLEGLMEALCSDKIDKPFTDDPKFIEENGNITVREVIGREFEKYAKKIREMKWITFEQWILEKENAVCPKCGSKDFEID